MTATNSLKGEKRGFISETKKEADITFETDNNKVRRRTTSAAATCS